MSKKKYTEEQINFVKDLVEKGFNITPSTEKMCIEFDIKYTDSVRRRISKIMQKIEVTHNVKIIEDSDVFKEAQKKEHDKTKKRYLISWPQSDTPNHKAHLRN